MRTLTLKRLNFFCYSALAAATLCHADDGTMSAAAINQRTLPVGQVHLEGQTINATPTIVGRPTVMRSAEDIYNTACHVCHSSGVAGSPKLGDKSAWAPRIQQGEATLFAHAIAGYKLMPARGTCDTCSDEEIKATVKHMINHSK